MSSNDCQISVVPRKGWSAEIIFFVYSGNLTGLILCTSSVDSPSSRKQQFQNTQSSFTTLVPTYLPGQAIFLPPLPQLPWPQKRGSRRTVIKVSYLQKITYFWHFDQLGGSALTAAHYRSSQGWKQPKIVGINMNIQNAT